MKASPDLKAFPLALFLAIPSLSAQNIVLFDDMTGSAYADFSFNDSDSGSNPDDISSAFGNIETSGGNPGSFLQVFHDHDVDRDEFGDPFGDSLTSIQSFFDNTALSHTPSTQGIVDSITFSLDIRTSDPIDAIFFSINDSTGGTLANGGAGILPIVGDGQWQTITLPGVTQAGAPGRNFSGSDPLSFGFGFISSADVFGGPETFTLQADNFRIEINPIPEPSSALLVALGLLGLARRRR